jgi:hypothetical protein
VRRYKLAALCCGLLFTAGGVTLLIHFFINQGLTKASLWATVLAFGLTCLGTVATVWTLVLMIRQGEVHSAPPSGNSSGDQQRSAMIRQVNSNGTNIVHTGEGDINYSGPAK